MDLDQKIEGVLFYKAMPVKKRALCSLLQIDETALQNALETLQKRLSLGAIRLITTDTEAELVTAPELDPLIQDMQKDEMRRDIGKAGAETLAIVLYRGPITRAEIDRIRGVNSSFILRNLMARGLVERLASGKQNQYQVTPELLAYLGISKSDELAGHAETMDALDKYEQQYQNETL